MITAFSTKFNKWADLFGAAIRSNNAIKFIKGGMKWKSREKVLFPFCSFRFCPGTIIVVNWEWRQRSFAVQFCLCHDWRKVQNELFICCISRDQFCWHISKSILCCVSCLLVVGLVVVAPDEEDDVNMKNHEAHLPFVYINAPEAQMFYVFLMKEMLF